MSLISLTSGWTSPYSKVPIASAVADPAYGIVGSVVRLDGQRSSNPSALPPRSGSDATTSGSNIINAPSGGFTLEDSDRIITLTGTDAGAYRIISVVSPTQITVAVAGTNADPLFVGGNSSWAIVDALSFAWKFSSTPTGSRVVQEGFRVLDPDGSQVSFSPDVVGEYIISLTVSNGVFESSPYEVRASIRAILVPHARGIVPDGKWVWSYIRDVWNQVENKEWFETFWSALLQISGAELLKTYQVDFNKSIRDIQALFQRRWLKYEPWLDITSDDASVFLCGGGAGVDGTSVEIGNNGEMLILSSSEFIIVQGSVYPDAAGSIISIVYDQMQPLNVGDYKILNVNTAKTGYILAPPTIDYPAPDPIQDRILVGVNFYFALKSTTWSLAYTDAPDYALKMSKYPSPIEALLPILDSSTGSAAAALINEGDYIVISSGPNIGYYRILSKSGSFVTVDHAPPGDATIASPSVGTVYRPVGFHINRPPKLLTDSFAIPYTGNEGLAELAAGRIVTLGGQAYSVLRVYVDTSQATPVVIITTTDGAVLFGFSGLPWRVPNTLTSSTQNFEELGVSSGDLLLFNVTSGESSSVVEVVAQVVGVLGNSLGFVLTDEPLTPGVVPDVPGKTYEALSTGLSVPTAFVNSQGVLSIDGAAKLIVDYLNSGEFQRAFCNKKLSFPFTVTIQGRTFTVTPSGVIRNRLVPVDPTVASIPMLQEWIVQPSWVQKNGKTYQVKSGKEYEIRGPPLTLVENTDYVVDAELALDGELVFESGSSTIQVQDGHFIDRDIRPGDAFIIKSPVTLAGTYYVSSVVSQDTLLLSTPVPAYALGISVNAKVQIRRQRNGTFIRFTPGGFTAKNPAPRRFWAEATLFDNSDSIEGNFGILVGLTRSDLEKISETINYRQAVAGLMYAYTRGSALDEVRLGAQILLGLPFAESRGIIRSIENDYRLNALGNPILGRMLIEDIDSTNTPLGTLRVYTFPIDLESTLSGVDTNPQTGKTYAVGDTVELFAILSKGVEAYDYISEPLVGASAEQSLKQFHTLRLRANDSIFSLSELSLVSEFLSKITPSYVSFVVSSMAEFRDNVNITDALTPRLGTQANPLVDNASLGLSSTFMLDNRSPFGEHKTIFVDDGVFTIRKSGVGLSTTYNGGVPSSTATLVAGGFVTPAFGEGPVVRAGDVLHITEGSNQGFYPITTVSDTTLDVSGVPPKGFNTANQRFAILRPVKALLRSGTINTTAGDPLVQVEPGLIDDGVMPGDLLFISYGATWALHRVLEVGPLAAPSTVISGKMRVSPTPATTSAGTYRVLREAFMESPYQGATGTLTSSGLAYTALDQLLMALCDPNDELQVQDSTSLRLLALDPKNLAFAPVLPAGSYTVKLCKRSRPVSAAGWDHIPTFDPTDIVEASLVEGDISAATCTAGIPTVVLQQWAAGPGYAAFDPTTHGVKPGDLLVLTNGANSSVDVGYGLGVYPIVAISPANVTLGVNLTSNDPSGWKILRRR